MKNIRSRNAYFRGKLIRYTLTLLIILSVNFFIPRAMPGDPMINLLGNDVAYINDQLLEEMRHEYGLDRPLIDQYFSYMKGVAIGDFGYSIHKNLDVSDLISDRLIRTVLLVFPSIVIGAVIALIAGSVAGFRSGGRMDKTLTALSMFMYTCPHFLVAMLAVSIFSFHLDWFPLGNMSSGNLTGINYIIDVGWHLFLPIAVLALFGATYDFLVVRNSIKQIMGEYYIFVAKAKGMPDQVVRQRHVLRNVMPQFISLIALSFGFMVSGALLLEIVFSLDGMGSLIYDAVLSRDYPVMQGCFVVLTLFVVAANFLADILYGLADPRIGDARS